MIKIICDREEEKQQLLKESEYVHDFIVTDDDVNESNSDHDGQFYIGLDSDKANTLMHIYTAPEMIEVQKKESCNQCGGSGLVGPNPEEQFPCTECSHKKEWTSVKDELPKENVPVLSFGSVGKQVAWYSKSTGWCDTDRKLYRVTHWMPLPNDPK